MKQIEYEGKPYMVFEGVVYPKAKEPTDVPAYLELWEKSLIVPEKGRILSIGLHMDNNFEFKAYTDEELSKMSLDEKRKIFRARLSFHSILLNYAMTNGKIYEVEGNGVIRRAIVSENVKS